MVKVSVLMGVYNSKDKELLKKSILSIINQTFKDWELIICDDGSTDDTLVHLNSIAKLDTRIIVISSGRNQGLSNALNQCLALAQGVYIARQDDDDISIENRLERQVEFLDNHREYGIVGSLANIFDGRGIWGEFNVPERPDKYSFYWNSPFIHPTIMMHKQILIDCSGYRISKETRRCEDYDLFMRIYAKGYKGYNLQEKLYEYQIENNPCTKYRPMKYRIDECIVRFKGYKELNILNIIGLLYTIKPIVIGLIPSRIFYFIRKYNYTS